MIRIFTDSTSDLPAEFIEEHHIGILPLRVIIGDEEYIDGVTISTKEVYAVMRENIMPTTSQVSIVEVQEAFEQELMAGNDIICLTFSSKMSGTYHMIAGVGRELGEKYPERQIAVFDAKGGSFATGLIVMKAAKMAENGFNFTKMTENCHFMIEHVQHVFVITDLNWMIRGGRISKTLGFTANILHIKPILDVADGEMEVIAKVRGEQRSMQRVADIVCERAKNYPNQTIGITHADDILAAEHMKGLLQERLPECDFLIEEIGPVLGVHLGIGGVGVFFFSEDIN